MLELFTQNLSKILPNFQDFKYVLAISGGMDSIVLLELMSELVSSDRLVIAHFDHGTRHGQSIEDAKFVEECALRQQLTFELGHREGHKLSETALRKERYDFLEQVRRRHNCDYIVFAHHLQDQLETFLMRLIRGTGLDGLGVMEPLKGGWIRPLLKFSKESLEKEISKRDLKFRLDSSNLEPQNFRNEVRLNLLPIMEKLSERYGGKEMWLQRLEPMFEEIQWTKKELNRKIKKSLSSSWIQTAFWSRISKVTMDIFTSLERRRALRMILSEVGAETLSIVELKRLETALEARKKNYCGPGIEVSESCGFLYFRKQSESKKKIKLEYRTFDNRVICDLLGLSLKIKGELEGVEWRHYRPGDRFRGKKVKEYFLEKRIPKWERSFIPVLAKKDSNELEWIYPELNPRILVEQLSFPFAIQK